MYKTHDMPGKDGRVGALDVLPRIASPLPRILYKQLGKDAQITPKEVLDWQYDKHSYTVEAAFTTSRPKRSNWISSWWFPVPKPVRGSGERKWYVNLPMSQPISGSVKYTPIGEGMKRCACAPKRS